jgi:SAM-dependent methyltransferase
MKRVERPEVRDGYDLWSQTYDDTPNPLLSLDRRITLPLLDPKRDEWVLDAACGTGQHLRAIADAGGRPIGLDFSRAMLRVARQRVPGVPLVHADLDDDLPFLAEDFEAILSALAGEHLRSLPAFFRGAFAAPDYRCLGSSRVDLAAPIGQPAGVDRPLEQVSIDL